MNITYNNIPIAVDTQDAANPLFSTKDICKALNTRRKIANPLLDKYGVIRLATKRNNHAYALFRGWFIAEFRVWFEGRLTQVTDTTPLPKMAEIDEDDINAYILNNI